MPAIAEVTRFQDARDPIDDSRGSIEILSGWVSIHRPRRPQYAGSGREGRVLRARFDGATDERCSSAGRHTQGRLHPHVRRRAQPLGRERTAFRRLGDLPPQGIAGRPESPLRVAVERLVRPAHSALERRRPDVGAGRQQVRLRRRAGHAPVVRRHAASRGSSSASGTSSRRSPIRTRSTPASRTRRCSAPPTAAARGTSCRACASTARARTGSRARAACACTPSCSTRRITSGMFIAISAAGAFRTDDGGETWKPINRGLRSEGIPEPDGGSRPLRPSHRDAPLAARRAVHAEALGRHAQRRRRRLVARGERQSADRLRLRHRRARARAGDDLRRADQERLRALSARRQAARLSQPQRRHEWEALEQGAAAARLLRQRPARRDGRRLARLVRRLLRDDRRPGLRLRRRRRQLERRSSATCRRCSSVGGADAVD